MFSRIKKYISERKKKKEIELYRSGFGWAMTRFYCDGLPTEEIESWVELSKQFGNYNKFDRGVEHAIKIIENNNKPA